MTNKRSTYFLFLSILIFSLTETLHTQAANSPELPASTRDLVRFSAKLEPERIREQEIFRLEVKAELKPGWHIYSVIPLNSDDAPRPTKVSLEPGLFVEDGPLYETRPVELYVDVLKLTIYYHENKAELYRNLKLARDFKAGSYDTTVTLEYQLCTDVICLPIESRELGLTFTLEPGLAREKYLVADRRINPLPTKAGAIGLTALLSDGIWAFLGLAALMGLASLLTPCVFPMIPITVSFFSKQAEGNQTRVIKLALLFAAGIILTYTGFGLLISAIFGAGSALTLASNPFVNLTIAFVFIVFAFSLMGVFTISLPAGVQNYFDQKSRSMGGAVGVLLMGFTFTLTAFTCTVQFVGTMLIAAAQGEWIWPLLGMLVFSGIFAFPFFLLAVAPSLVRKMQGKSGVWLGRSKFVLGVMELMVSIKFLSNADLVWQTNLITRNIVILIWMGLTVLIVLYLVWTGIRPTLNRSLLQWSSFVVFSMVVVLLGQGWNDRSLGSLIDAVLPPPSGFHLTSEDFISEEEAAKIVWLDNLDQAHQLALSQNKPILLEFTGYTCINCRWMEQNVLALRTIYQKLMTDFILVRLFTDGGSDAKQNLNLQINRFQTVALPYYVRLNSDSTVHSTFSGISLNPQEFIDFLSR
jgi:thiol:disulfide interchange protein DsbD